MTTNQIAYQNYLEKVRNNQALEFENARHNEATESINRGNLDVSVFLSKETERHNKAMESIQATANALNYQINLLNARSNELQAQTAGARAAEEVRHNQAQELLTSQRQNQEYDVSLRNLGLKGEELALATEKFEWQQQYENALLITNAINTIGNTISNIFKSGSSLVQLLS